MKQVVFESGYKNIDWFVCGCFWRPGWSIKGEDQHCPAWSRVVGDARFVVDIRHGEHAPYLSDQTALIACQK